MRGLPITIMRVLAVFAVLVGGTLVAAGPVRATPQVGHGAGSVTQAYLTGATPGAAVVLRNGAGARVGAGRVDRLGSFLVRELPPGAGYRFLVDGRAGNTFGVLDATPPSSSLYRQTVRPGMNYVRMRDGIELAVMVRLPVGKTLADGPFPTVVEYSGYQTAVPGDFLTGALRQVIGAADPAAPDTSTMLGGIVAPTAGFATATVQMRGSGCSGGAFDLFDHPTIYDGYDIIETVARQPWVAGHRVGMVGLSFSGISQIAVAGTRPPSLAAIAPMSITDDLYSTGYPGGIYNTGFAERWLAERQRHAEPAPSPGSQPYPNDAVAHGDRVCRANQRLRLQTQRITDLVADNPTRTPHLFEHRAPSSWASRITVPVFLSGSLQDEQTGPQWTSIIGEFARNRQVWVTIINGTHIDAVAPQILGPWNEFLDIFVAHRVPQTKPALTALGPLIYGAVTGGPGEAIVTARHPDAGSPARARKLFAADPRIRVFFGNGTGTGPPGNLSAPWSAGYQSWPPATVGGGLRLALNTGGRLGGAGPAGQVAFRPDPAARPAGTLDDDAPPGAAWVSAPPYAWTPVPGRAGVGFTSAPQASDTVVVGPASLDLRLSSSAPDTDLQATISEVRPDGDEQYVTTGYLRASLRATNSRSTPLDPRRDWLIRQPVPSGFTTARIALNPLGHVFRAGSRIRVTITAPGGDRPSWRFATPATGGRVVDTLALGPGGSVLVLPVVPGARAPTPRAPCAALRGQPCRRYQPAANGG
ncbi:MAG: CocE/NonD family hydrolase [Gordonia sp. (in: high G+C Gram-positive bacteria)]